MANLLLPAILIVLLTLSACTDPVPTAVVEPTATPAPTETDVADTQAEPTPAPTATPAPTTAQEGAMWRGISVAPEDRCSEYDPDDYHYSPSVEPRIVDTQGGIYGPYTGTWFDSIRGTDIEHIVARSEAHDSGLCDADPETKDQFASDLLNLTLASPSVNRHQCMVERRIRAARFPAVKSLDTFDFPAIPSVNKALVMELARCEYVQRRENVIAAVNSGTGKTHVALGLGLAACQRGMSVGFTTAAGLVHELMEARDERRLLNLQRQLTRLNLLIIDELGFVPLSRTGAELLFEVFSQRYERGSILVTTNLPFDEWTEIFGSERLTGALLDRLTHHVHILEMNGDSYRLRHSRESAVSPAPEEPGDA